MIRQGGTLNLTIQVSPVSLPYGYDLNVDLERLEEGSYKVFGVNYADDMAVNANTISIAPSINQDPNSYRLHIYIETETNYCILDTYYYFIIQ